MVVHVEVAPQLLRWAVERAGWDEDTLERRAPKFGSWTEGTQQPTLKQLERFAHDTHTPFGLLFLPEPPVEDLPITDMRTIGNVAVPRPSADLLDTIYLCQDRQEWYRQYAQENLARALEYVGSATTATAPADVAAQMSARLGFGLDERAGFANWSEALRQLVERVEDIGVLVMINGVVGANTHRVLDPNEFRGFALSDPVAPLIFVNGADTKAAQIFTLIHELAHIWLGESALTDAVAGRSEPRDWCGQTATEFLHLQNAVLDSTLPAANPVAMPQRTSSAQDRSGSRRYATNAHISRLSQRFAHAVVASTLAGETTYRDAYQLLSIKRLATFDSLAEQFGLI